MKINQCKLWIVMRKIWAKISTYGHFPDFLLLSFSIWLELLTLICNFVPTHMNFCAITNIPVQSYLCLLSSLYKAKGRRCLKIGQKRGQIDQKCPTILLLFNNTVFLHKPTLYPSPDYNLKSNYQSVDIWIRKRKLFTFNIDVVNVV